MERIPKGVAICLRKICDSDSKFEMCSAEYQEYKRIETYERSRNLKELISLYVFAKAIKKKKIVQLKSVAENMIFVKFSSIFD